MLGCVRWALSPVAAVMSGLPLIRATPGTDQLAVGPPDIDRRGPDIVREAPDIDRDTLILSNLTVEKGTDGWGETFAAVDGGALLPSSNKPSLSFLTGQAVAAAKSKLRPSVPPEPSTWRVNNYHTHFSLSALFSVDHFPRQDSTRLSRDDFVRRYELRKQPAVLSRLMDDWPALRKWTAENISQHYGNNTFQCGSQASIKMMYFAEYCRTTKDDDGISVVHSQLPDEMAADYTIPDLFPDKSLPSFKEEGRSTNRWFQMGPARSGSGLQRISLGTSSWTGLIAGHKRWCLFPRGTPVDLLVPSAAAMSELKGGLSNDSAIVWFNTIYPRTQRPDWPHQWTPVEILQSSGEVVFVPAGWWSVVLNLDTTTSITHNYQYVSQKNYDSINRIAKELLEKLAAKKQLDSSVLKPESRVDVDVNITALYQPDKLPRSDSRVLSHEQFVSRHEWPKQPAVLTHLIDDWPALHKWTVENITQHYGDMKFRFGDDQSIVMKLKNYIKYCKTTRAASGIYLVKSTEKLKKLRDDMKTPSIFRTNLFSVLGDLQPVNQWILIGPPRSGVHIHRDTWAAHAWNIVIDGHKRWCMFPPDTPSELIKMFDEDIKHVKEAHRGEGGRGSAIAWYDIVYPRTKRPDWPSKWKPVEILQSPGETVFIPSGWWHVVLNLDVTVSLSNQYTVESNFENSWTVSKALRPKMVEKLQRCLKPVRPDLSEWAEYLHNKTSCGLDTLLESDYDKYLSDESTSYSACGDLD